MIVFSCFVRVGYCIFTIWGQRYAQCIPNVVVPFYGGRWLDQIFARPTPRGMKKPTLLRCDLLAKKVPGRAPYSQHIIIRNWTYLNRSKTEHLKSFRPKTANKPINKLDRRRIWQKSVGSKSVQGEDRKERVANRELCR